MAINDKKRAITNYLREPNLINTNQVIKELDLDEYIAITGVEFEKGKMISELFNEDIQDDIVCESIYTGLVKGYFKLSDMPGLNIGVKLNRRTIILIGRLRKLYNIDIKYIEDVLNDEGMDGFFAEYYPDNSILDFYLDRLYLYDYLGYESNLIYKPINELSLLDILNEIPKDKSRYDAEVKLKQTYENKLFMLNYLASQEGSVNRELIKQVTKELRANLTLQGGILK